MHVATLEAPSADSSVEVVSAVQTDVCKAATSSSAVRPGGMVAVREDCWKTVTATEALRAAVVAVRLEVSSASVTLRLRLALAESCREVCTAYDAGGKGGARGGCRGGVAGGGGGDVGRGGGGEGEGSGGGGEGKRESQ